MSYNEWTTHEVARLRRIFSRALDDDLALELPRHLLGSIKEMARRLGLHRAQKRISSARKWQRIAAAHVPTFAFGAAKT